jgi:hypothetical protein
MLTGKEKKEGGELGNTYIIPQNEMHLKILKNIFYTSVLEALCTPVFQ